MPDMITQINIVNMIDITDSKDVMVILNLSIPP